MGILERGLAKLTITAYADRDMKSAVGAISAMYNPASIHLSYHTDYAADAFINSPKQSNRYQQARPGGLSLDLLFDARLPGNTTPLDDQLARLRALCCEVDAGSGETRFLQVKWGKMSWNGRGYFAGRMASLSVNYTLFDRDATPLRAKATLNLTADDSLVLQKSQYDLAAPDTNVVTVPDMSPLTLIAAGAATDYLALAMSNGLDNLDDIQPGETLVVNRGEQS